MARRHRAVLTPADGAAAALGGSATTEVFTGYGAEAGFEDRVREFAARVGGEAPAGYRGCAVGPVEVEGEGEGRGGPAVGLVVGWDSREAHLEAKGRAGGEAFFLSFSFLFFDQLPFPFWTFLLVMLFLFANLVVVGTAPPPAAHSHPGEYPSVARLEEGG